MLLVSFCSWWYGAGWLRVIRSLSLRMQEVSDAFSVGQLFKTLFAPWRRIMTYPGRSLQARFQAWADTTFSRAVGFVVRLIVILTAFVTMIVVVLLTVLEVIVWPLIPLAVPALIIAGFVL